MILVSPLRWLCTRLLLRAEQGWAGQARAGQSSKSFQTHVDYLFVVCARFALALTDYAEHPVFIKTFFPCLMAHQHS